MKELLDRINEYLRVEIKPKLQQHEQLKDVVIWVNDYREDSKVIYLGMALGKGTGCSPFCGCAAGQLADQMGAFLKERFPNEVRAVAGVATLPPDEAKDSWNKA